MENKEETMEMQVLEQDNYQVMNLADLGKNSQTKTEVFTNITDEKKIFNLENKVDAMLNDCENEVIVVKEVLIKRYTKPLKEPIVNEETGEIEKEYKFSMSCVIVDNKDKSYATGSKTFTIQLMRYLQMKERTNKKDEELTIKIIKKKTPNGNKALSFELV